MAKKKAAAMSRQEMAENLRIAAEAIEGLPAELWHELNADRRLASLSDRAAKRARSASEQIVARMKRLADRLEKNSNAQQLRQPKKRLRRGRKSST